MIVLTAPVSVLVLDLPSATRSPAESATRGRAQTHFFFAQLPLGQSATKRFKSGLVQKIARPASPARSAPTGSTNRYSWRSGDDAYLVQGSAAQVQELFLALKGSVSVYGSGPATDERRRAQNQKELAPPVRMAIRQMPDQGLPGSAPAVGDLRFVLVLRSAAPAPTKRR